MRLARPTPSPVLMTNETLQRWHGVFKLPADPLW